MKYIDDFLEYLLVVKKHSDNTITNYQVDLLEFSQFMNEKIIDINKEDVNSYLKLLYDNNYSKSSISRKLSSLRSFYDYLVKKEIVKNKYFKMIKNPR